ncbi:MAG: DUF2203 domain-containing protein [Dehalococcoidia bacterium]
MRMYTLEEARAVLPEVIPVLEQLRLAYVELRAIRALRAVTAERTTGDGNLIETSAESASSNERIEELTDALQQATDLLEARGILLKDPERGLIDFYHERHGEVVFLCFQLGEDGIRYWHHVQAGFAGRQPL